MVNFAKLVAELAINAPDIPIAGLSMDSRTVNKGDLYIAVMGARLDGRIFIDDAISNGAIAVLSECESKQQHGSVTYNGAIPVVHIYQLRKKVSAIAHYFYQSPSDDLTTFAVTGTNGKTTVVNLLGQFLQQLDCQYALSGTLGFQCQDIFTDDGLTTSDPITVQRQAATAIAKGADYLCIEASSHALDQGRLAALNISTAIFTNLTRDHLDYHQSMKAYGAAKRKLLKARGLRQVVVNHDEPESNKWLVDNHRGITTVHYGLTEQVCQFEHYVYASDVEMSDRGIAFQLQSSWGNATVSTALIGHFNLSNLLAVVGAMLSEGLDFERVVAAIAKLQPVVGRMELFQSAEHANVIVDYAHTPDALEQGLKAARRHTDGQLWCVFGCGGDRDSGKRPMMAQIAEKYSDAIVVTSDNPRTEDPHAIIADVMTGFSGEQQVIVEVERQQAIVKVLEEAGKQDLIFLAGKGHETYQVIGTNRVDYDERAWVQQLMSGE